MHDVQGHTPNNKEGKRIKNIFEENINSHEPIEIMKRRFKQYREGVEEVKTRQKNKEMEAYGKNDMSMFLNDDAPKKKFYYYETEKYLDEEEDLMEVAYGY